MSFNLNATKLLLFYSHILVRPNCAALQTSKANLEFLNNYNFIRKTAL